MLDWSKIDNDKDFQRLINHLFALECNSPGFIPSSPYIGADGGWDGYFKGIYPPEGSDGIWSIQAKWTKYSLDDAFKAIKPRIKEELKKAVENNVEHIRIVTNAELRVGHITELEELVHTEEIIEELKGLINNAKIHTLKIWAREDLNQRIELQPYLRHLFFDLYQYPKFVPPNFSKFTKGLELSNLNSNFDKYLEKAEKFVSEKGKSVLIIHSSGDYGKTYLINEIAKNVHKINSELQCWMVNPGYREMKSALQDEIVSERKYLLIFDDADRYLEEISPLLSFCKHHNEHIKVILACREAGLKYICDVIKNEQIQDFYESLKIQRWAKNDLIQLLKEITEEDRLEFEEIAVRYSSPSLMVFIGNRIRNKANCDFDKFEEKYVDKLTCDAKRCLEDFIDPQEVKDFLLNIACIIPFSEEDNIVLEKITNEFNLKELEVKEMIRNLKDGGVLRNVGGYIRFDPDLKGDLFLAYELKKLSNEKIENLINTWLLICADRVFINLEEAFAYEQIDSLKDILSEMINNWIINALKTDGYSRIQNLNLLKEMCIIVPENCLDIMNVYLDAEAPISKDPTAKFWGMENRSPRTGNYSPIILKLMNFDKLRKDLVILIEKITSKNFDFPFFNSTSSQLIKRFVDPTENSINSIIETLDVFDEWLDNPNEVRIELISTALSEVLLGAHDQKVLIQMRIYWWEVPQPRTNKIIEMRKKALDVLKRMTSYSSGKYLKKSIEVANNIGRTTKVEEDLPISDIILHENEEFIDTVGQLITDETDFEVLIEIEGLFLDWWARKKVHPHKIQKYLSKISKNIEYVTFKYFEGNFVVEDFDSFFEAFERESAVEDGWKWFLDKKVEYRKNTYKPAHYKNFVSKLNKIYKTENQVLILLLDLEKRLKDSRVNAPIINCWVKFNSGLFLSIRNENNVWNRVPKRFKREIDIALSEIDVNHIKILSKEVLPNITSEFYFEIETFLISMGNTDNLKTINLWILELLNKGNSKIRWLVISYIDLIFRDKLVHDCRIRYLILAISKENELSDEMVDRIDLEILFLNGKLNFINPNVLNCFKKDLIKKMKDVPDITEKQEILNFILDDIDLVIEFIDYRLNKYKDIRKLEVRPEYNPLPFDGIQSIKKCINSFEDFEKFMNKIIEWDENIKWGKRFLIDIKSNILICKKESGKLFIEEYIENKAKNGEIESVIESLNFLPFEEERIPFIINISEDIIKSKALNANKIEKLFYRKSRLEDGYSTIAGEVPKELLEKKALFEKIQEKAKPGRLRSIINNCIKRIDQEIEWHVKRDEETLNPRR
ncbi:MULTISPECIES: P-loop NTPase [Methanobacterium]|uniref:Novel STAND NTPase 5 domain-containing protein n=1 Tax=Methanobacterium bryantii TaxID=2161 RepID=A0A2A2H3T8_METBR|nr:MULTISPECIES: hypothetical protein [Methanobacterium]OEC86747.1 hypothetical protein A9507_09875 [Methanobacterium sp. A39]PAV04025.1 hypothetical protein ASJ80_03150 [Methanobacterium bryantii]